MPATHRPPTQHDTESSALLPTVDVLTGQDIAVWGSGSEGSAILRFLRRHLPNQSITLIDDQSFSDGHQQLIDELGAIHFQQSSTLTTDRLSSFDCIIRSPGVYIYRDEIKQACNLGVVVTTGSNLWYASKPKGKIIAITGSKGKSTTTALLGHLIKSLGKHVNVGGNIGKPLIELADLDEQPEYWVIELSSYQITDLAWRPDIALLTCLHPAHLTWHGSLERYYDDKLKLFDDTEKTLAIINQADPEIKTRLAARSHIQVYNTNGSLVAKSDGVYRRNDLLVRDNQIALRGEHNYQNICGALTVIEALDINVETVIPALATFQGLPHRLETIAEIDGVTYVNDSIATIPEATLMAIKSFPKQPVTLLIGGQDTGQDWQSFAKTLSQQPPQTVISMHQTGNAIAKALGEYNGFNLFKTENLEQALAKARDITPGGGVILLSPGAPSFDAYDSFEHRAAEFARLIQN